MIVSHVIKCLLLLSVLFFTISSNSPVESEVDLDLGYIENALTDYDSQHIQ